MRRNDRRDGRVGRFVCGHAGTIVPATVFQRAGGRQVGIMNQPSTTEELRKSRCVPCEGGVPKLTPEEIEQQLRLVTGWQFRPDPDRIHRSWVVKNFMAGIDFFSRVAAIAEEEGHHPDLHLHGYRNVEIEIWTHAIGGLSLNDLILAARIDELDIETA